MKIRLLSILLVLCFIGGLFSPRPVYGVEDGGETLYLPIVFRNYDPYAHFRTVNAPYTTRFVESAILWFGRVGPAENYTDVRVRYTDSELVVDFGVFDRRIWYNSSPSSGALEYWDAATLLLNTAVNAPERPGGQSYRFVAQFKGLGNGETLPLPYKAVYRGTGSGWQSQNISFSVETGWRGDALNDDGDDRGWRITFRIPYASLGLSRPAEGSRWRMALISHDRDSRAGPPGTSFIWPEAAERDEPATWGVLRFGLPSYAPPSVRNLTSLLIREGENGAVVPDAAVGGTISNQCPGDDYHIWNVWGNRNYANENSALIQNQADIADWPCFSKYYLTFPLDRLPPGKVIRSARLVLHHWGGSGKICSDPDQNPDPDCARSSYIQILTVVNSWQEDTITWNNAPPAFENVAMLQVPPYNIDQPGQSWPGARREWDVSYALAKAYDQRVGWISFAVYSADSAYHSGKYFSASETEDWNKIGRPTLIIEYGD
ncbi:hypothetical protein BECAL_00565 [Bellilinea caldifistulae]|uniref:DNRLRE domain-containing protein n=1 Tax=Bellilinea caldifistulae TaxID=360411 RepID=UPI000785EA2F|nr:DNRLRE domain-containing protein [Bellilinea caldifistulae]GAP09421.1 hypothetical protein BECAL_00565 [Bellilinea caldifistulae]